MRACVQARRFLPVWVCRWIHPLYSTYRTSDLGLRERARGFTTTGDGRGSLGIATTALLEDAAHLSQSFMFCTARSASNFTIASFFFRRVLSTSAAETLSRRAFTFLCALKKAYENVTAGRLQWGQSFS